LSGLQDKFNDIKENQYASHVKEPLGKGFQRGYQWPDKTQGGNIAFGVPSTGIQNAKEMLYPKGGAVDNEPDIQAMYRLTHGNFAPGE
jgi:hypothetical protein